MYDCGVVGIGDGRNRCLLYIDCCFEKLFDLEFMYLFFDWEYMMKNIIMVMFVSWID